MVQESADAEGPVVEKIMSSRSVKKKVKRKFLPSIFLNKYVSVKTPSKFSKNAWIFLIEKHFTEYRSFPKNLFRER